MAKPIITLNGLKIVIMLGMLVIILTGIRFAADIIVPFVLAIFLAVVINPLVQLMVRCRVPRVLAISLLVGVIVLLAVVLLASLGTSLNELARTLPQYRNYLYEPMQTVAPWLQRFGFTVSVVELNKYIDPNAVMTPGNRAAYPAFQRDVLYLPAAADGGVYAAGSAAASREAAAVDVAAGRGNGRDSARAG